MDAFDSKTFRTLLGNVTADNKMARDGFIDALSLNQYKEFTKRRRIAFKEASSLWLNSIDIRKITSCKNKIKLFNEWLLANKNMNHVNRRSEFELVA